MDDLLVSRLLIQANSGGGKSGLARKIMEQSYGKVPFIVIDYDGEYYTLKEKLRDVIVIGGHAADIPISLQAAKLLPKEIVSNRLSVVIDPSEMKMGARIQYVKTFLETMMELPKALWVPYFVFVEEAHKYCGEQDKQESAAAVKDLMSRGRKMGYCGILLTQRISKLHKDAAAECNNKFIGRTNLDIDMDRAARELGFTASSEYTRLSLRDLIPRHFYCYGTSINPHHVHEITVGLCETTIPKSGTIVDIKPRKPTEKVMAALTKLSLLPAAAVKETKDIAELQKEVSRLKGELSKGPKAAIPDSNKQVQQAREDMRKHYTVVLKERDGMLATAYGQVRKLQGVMAKICQLSGGNPVELPAIPAIPAASSNPTGHRGEAGIVRPVKKVPVNAGNGTLGKCAKAIVAFLASHADRDWSKAQVAVVTGYSVGSGSFNNALSELTSLGFILRGGKIRANPDAMNEIDSAVGGIGAQEYSVETFKENLGKCEREIYEVFLESPHDTHSKESLAAKTPSNYSPGSGSFNNALSRLTTLELITRDNGKIQLNPELIELM